MEKQFKFRCTNCYGTCGENEGCFTNNIEEFVNAKESSCLDGTWGDGVKPDFKEIN